MRTRRPLIAVAALLTALTAACGTGGPNPAAQARLDGTHAMSGAGSVGATTHGSGTAGHTGAATPSVAPAALRAGETMRTVTMAAPYTPKAPSTGTDDYRCFLLDPGITADSFVTGFDVQPGQPAEVHHVILYRVNPDKVAAARAKDAAAPGDGWTCFGGTGIESQGATLADAPWVGAWAPGGHERLLPPDIGIPLATGSQLILQVHYNLLRGSTPDRTAVRLRLSASSKLSPLETMLFPAPVELPCRPGHTGALCDRDKAIWDVATRFGRQASFTVAGLLLLCGEDKPHPGPTQSCTRTVGEAATVRTVAGHMHLLGSSLRIVLNEGTARARALLDIAQWNFDNQGSISIPATTIRPGDTITVSCTHDQSWRDRLPGLKGIPERYVVWGEGTTDEMCLGILGVTKP
ncbi:monooxygenase [Intrasporangium oryzae NRRL B-24470]|uniref:Monooxygenase n=1 Tax=Intrasporangium oryzae NRRL B-24470 TaxID=1386089 RepID=W9G649_9MICO|nr:hypothetical protein [Intrasporangium oryzae]EWT00278.1 monooxygenase [Intrasporangium oryzae NRRL B-24470]